jgi:tripartite-type tricarboxylate transporter receptor subunit TctC
MHFPEKPIRIILPFGPPGFSSRVGFVMQPHMADFLDQEIYFEHITGGLGGSNGPHAAAVADPDGYSLLMGTIGNIALLPNILPDYGIDPLHDFTPIIKIADTPNLLIAHPSLGTVTLDDVVAAAKANPGSVKFHGINKRSIHLLEFKSLIAETGISLNEMPPEGGSEGAIEAIINGDIDLTITTGPRLLESIRNGDVIPIAAISPIRIDVYKDIPTMQELGLKTIGSGSWMGLFAPTGVPSEIIQKLFDAAKHASEQPDVINALNEQAAGINISPSPEDALTFVENETTRLQQACIAAKFF